ncbi:hypothetical protein BRYFOR_08653 [Marvinbryantia formatexigens DSM 14469]|uniref:Uncharacterized protein n=1 Tax=Marvinbryantia formatexigens DSM 14469 TaxID=478749 RepID=C6LJ19_9FIRM|nr:hypothetical protein [Marvinbryantia formatexigens]EET59339.1 hypothetical protein BRYFOR_08653 [Marvinbryantia formatexigens DSM 14469]
MTAFTVFLLSFFAELCKRQICGVGCRFPPRPIWIFKKFILIGGNKYGLQQSQRRKKMAALERSRGKEIAENLGVSEDTIERLRIHDWAIFNSDRRYYEKLQEAGTYLEEVAESAPQSGVKTVDDFLDSIENDRLYEILIEVDRFKEKLKKFLR